MTLLIIYLLAYLMAGAPTITSIEGWVVFGVIAVAAAFAGAISEVGSEVTVQLSTEEDEDDIGF
jgi:hypothetical protein